ncbi:hypothetical protein FRC03_003766 [Tulasnella sp. 419]|nr:hypothetical protein FRC02_005420 [Tulasnella sp. 418]KAG8969241.1 hypothetical protein FRC03_003766 [Tulasnella sp. 419]
MAGPNLELFKFGVYVFIPIAMMVHYGNPQWYNDHVLPYRERFWPKPDHLNRNLPQTSSELKQELERIKAERLQAKKDAQAAAPTPSTTVNEQEKKQQPSEPVRLV